MLERFWAKVDQATTPDGCWTWTASYFNCGYGKISYEGVINNAHRVIWVLLNGKPPAGMVVMHTCDNYACVRPAHLRLGTQKENLNDMTLRGRRTGAKLTPKAVRVIRERHRAGERCNALAKDYGISTCTMSKLLTGKIWKCVI